jgi:hypothetical protein
MSHKFRFSLVAVLTLLAMFITPQVTMAASQHSVASAQAGVQNVSLHYYKAQKQYYSGDDDPEYSADEDSSSWQSQDPESVPSFWWHRSKSHVVVVVRIKCRFFSCNIGSFDGNHIDIGGKKHECLDGGSVSFTATIGVTPHTVRIEGNPATPGIVNIFVDSSTTPVIGTVGLGGVITFPEQTGLGGATSIVLTASGIVLAGATISDITFGCA